MKPVPDNELIFAIDPGNIESAFCKLRGRVIVEFQKVPNDMLLGVLKATRYDHVVCEMICSYGMPAGASLFDTCVFIGEIRAAVQGRVTLMPRIQVKSHICHSGKATDSNIRQALIDRFGPPGTKKQPGPTYGLSADCWSALAIAETFRSGDYTSYQLSHEKFKPVIQ
jgi:hypothetical protein